MSFEARYRGMCGICDEPITPGQRVQHDPAGVVEHVDCPAAADHDIPHRNEKRCTECQLIHAGECF